MDRAEAEDEVAAINGRDGAAGEERGERVEREAVGGIVEHGHEDDLVGDVEIGVAGGKALAVEINGRGHGQRFDAQRIPVLIFHAF